MAGDALSEVLRAIHLGGSMFFRVRLRAPYAVTAQGVRDLIEEYAPGVQHMLPFHLVTRGSMWFEVAGAGAVRLEENDIIVLPHGADHSLMDAPGTPAIPVADLDHAISGHPPTLEWGGGGEPAEALCGFFHCNGRLFNPLLSALPEVLVIRHDSERSPWLTATLSRTFQETLRDPIAGGVLDLFHARPEYPWTLDHLARELGASRSVIADRFHAAVGLSPIRYLAAWRMELAVQRLEETNDSVTEIAVSLGYESDASFNRAFRRHTGEPPAAWRRRFRSGALAAVGSEVSA